ncbi:MAG: Gfo/Idh/MocA family oxidoreductase [Planctomycetota bacterium]|nr:Gfo/Idh/MocA family oxidoreductase [Planctomycetota bacterium]
MAAIVPRHVLGGPRHVPPSDKINLAYVGCGTQGFRQMTQALEKPEINITAVCDPNRGSDDYPDYGNDELNNRIRKFLNDPQWANGARGAFCGREPGQQIVKRYYAAKKPSGRNADCRAYADVRELLAKEKDLDAVYIMTPDHLHAVIASAAMRQGKHVITHKPIANVLDELRTARNVARETGAATQLFCAAGQTSTPTICEWLAAGAIGSVREVHNWSTRPFWPQGMTERPTGTPPIPDGFDWDLWLGPAADRPYHPAYTHTVFRGWYDFGTGALGDMGHYSFHQIFEALKLGSPTSVEASRSQYWKIEGYRWRKQPQDLAYPQASVIRWEFPARGAMPPVALHWYDGGMRPPLLKELEDDGEPLPDEGLLFVGDSGKLLAGFTGDKPRLIPKARMAEFKQPPQTLPRPIGELEQFIRACRGGQPSDASFENAYPFAETIVLGTIALRVNRKLQWDAAKAEFTNSKEANELKSRKNRQGWEV